MSNILCKLSAFGTLLLVSACVTGGINETNYYAQCDSADNEACKVQLMLRSCAATANRYPYVRDRLLYEEYGALFTENAEFKIDGGSAAIGRAAIVQALRDRGPARAMRHTNTVVQMQATGEDTASGISYVTIWRSNNNASKPAEGEPWVQGEYHDEFKIQDEQCLIAKRFVKIVFRTD